VKIPKMLKKWDILFFILLFGIAYLYSYHIILFLRPCSMHQWRQCDGLSITLNYYKEGMHFFNPTLNNCGATGDGRTCPTECPLIYFAVALLWKTFGYHEYFFRFLEILIGFAGLYALFKLTQELVQDGVWALLVSLLLFTSPIFAFYTNNFITDTPGLSIALIGWYFFVKYYKTKRLSFYNISIFIFLLAGLFKITALLSFVPLVVIYVWELGRKPEDKREKLFINPVSQGIAIFLLLLFIVAWVVYSGYYRNLHNAGFFLTIQHPIWELDKNTIHIVLNKLYTKLLPQYFSMPIIFFTLALFLTLLINYKKMNRFYYWFILMVFSGCAAYVILWFSNFDVHDYYLINALIFIPTTLVSLLVFLKENYPSLFNSSKLKLVISIILTLNIYYCSVQMKLKYFAAQQYNFIIDEQDANYWKWYHWDYDAHTKSFETITPYLRNIGIARDDKVVSIPDKSPDISLYLMDQKGYTEFGSNESQDTDRIREFIHLGAKYLIVSSPSYLDYTWLKPYLKNKIGTYQNITIYNLKNLN